MHIFYTYFSTISNVRKALNTAFSRLQKESYAHIVEKVVNNLFPTLYIVYKSKYEIFLNIFVRLIKLLILL